MDRRTAAELNRRMLENLKANSTDLASREVKISSESFQSPERLTRERTSLFIDTPQPVAFAGELPAPNSYLTLNVLDTPVLLTRDEGGVLHAFINACAHRGAPVASGSGQARALVCPFHGWSYNTAGRLRGRPADACFNASTSDTDLQALTVCERFGIVVLGLGPAVTQAQVDNSLLEIADDLDALGLAHFRALDRREYRVAANWKLVNDLSLESYHFAALHRDSVAQMLSPSAVFDTFERHSRWAFPLKSIADLAEIPEEKWPESLQGSCTYTLYPGVTLLINALGAQMIRAEPGTHPGESVVSYIGMHDPQSDLQAARQAYEFGGDVFAQEDLPMAEACQRGISASHRDLPLGKNEPLLQFWHQLWDKASN